MAGPEPYDDLDAWRRDAVRWALFLLDDFARRWLGPPGGPGPAVWAQWLADPTRSAELCGRLGTQPAADPEARSSLVAHAQVMRDRASVTTPMPPLPTLAQRLTLSRAEEDILRLLWALQTSPEVDRLARVLWEDSAPGTGLDFLVACLSTDVGARSEVQRALGGTAPLRRTRLVVLLNKQVRWSRAALAEPVVDLLSGRVPALKPPFELRDEPVLVPADFLMTEAVRERMAQAEEDQPVRIWVVAPPSAVMADVVHALAATHDRPLVTCELGGLFQRQKVDLDAFTDGIRDALLLGGWLLVRAPTLWPDEAHFLIDSVAAQLAALPIPVVVVSETPGPLTQRLARGFTRIDWEPLDRDAIGTLWMVASPKRPLPPRRADLYRALTQFELSAQTGIAACLDAATRARRGGRERVNEVDLSEACQAQLDLGFEGLASRTPTPFSWDQLVLPPETADQLREVLIMCTRRSKVMSGWGFSRLVPYGNGVTAMFSGPSGTGKTMAACVIAKELGRPLYRVDLSQVFDRYVGETEKNLARIFEAARSGHAVLLFDEADGLFSQRTEVKSSNDRYANLEVNYLLQRIEGHSGIVLLTTNLDSSIDDAFRRRIRHTVRFPNPDAQARERLWRSMLPPEAEVEDDIDWSYLAAGYELAGGAIKNAMLRAAFLAAGDERAIGMDQLHAAAVAECAALGQLIRR